MRRLVWVLGILAALAVAGTSVLAVAVGDGPGEDAAPEEVTFSAHGLTVTLPGEHWTTGPGLGFEDARGEVRVGVASAGLYRHGFCAQLRDLTRAFVGVTPAGGASGSARDIARRWARWASYDAVAGEHLGRGEVRVRGHRADVVAEYPAGRCNPPRVHVSVVVRGDAALVLMRDLDVPDALPEAEAEAVIASLR